MVARHESFLNAWLLQTPTIWSSCHLPLMPVHFPGCGECQLENYNAGQHVSGRVVASCSDKSSLEIALDEHEHEHV